MYHGVSLYKYIKVDTVSDQETHRYWITYNTTLGLGHIYRQRGSKYWKAVSDLFTVPDYNHRTRQMAAHALFTAHSVIPILP